MVRALSNDLRKRVVVAVSKGESCRSAALRFGVAVPSVVKWSQRYRASGSVEPDRMGRQRRSVLDRHGDFIRERIRQTPHLTLHALKDALAARGVAMSHNAVWLFMRREGLRFKKTLFALAQGRSDMLRRRRRWRSWQAGLDPQRLAFIDETWIKTNMAPLRGWAPKGERLRAFAPHGRWRTMTFLGALRYDRLAAPCLFDGPINGECFRAYVQQILLSSLKPGDIVIMDNLGSHKSAALRRILRAVGARLWYLPPYSPDLNPIEQTFAKIKHWMRAAQKRTIDDISRHLGELIQTTQPAECKTTSAMQDTIQ